MGVVDAASGHVAAMGGVIPVSGGKKQREDAAVVLDQVDLADEILPGVAGRASVGQLLVLKDVAATDADEDVGPGFEGRAGFTGAGEYVAGAGAGCDIAGDPVGAASAEVGQRAVVGAFEEGAR